MGKVPMKRRRERFHQGSEMKISSLDEKFLAAMTFIEEKTFKIFKKMCLKGV